MIGRRRIFWVASAFLVAGLLAGGWQFVQAQVGGLAPGSPFELSEAVGLDRANNAVLTQWERAKTLLTMRRWDEAIEILRQLMETSEGQLMAVGPRRYVGLGDWCQLQLASLPPEALKLYRGQVDSTARRWYQRGLARRDGDWLQRVVDRAFASSYGDEALMALGEMALESGDYATARWNWERIVPVRDEGRGARGEGSDSVFSWPGYPDTNLNLATVRARLVLVSILEGAAGRARDELAAFAQLHPDAQGRLGKRHGKYVVLLITLLAESTTWSKRGPGSGVGNQGSDKVIDWPTFAGNPRRNRIATPLVDVGAVAWRAPLISPRLLRERRGGAMPAMPLSFHPLSVGDLILANNDRQIVALRCDTGQPAWGQTATIYQTELAGVAPPPVVLPNALGSPRFTMTVFQERLFARMGLPLTGQSRNIATAVQPGYLVCLDLSTQGRLLWKILPEEGWAFEGSPVADADGVYVAMRRRDIRPQAVVACFDADTGRPRWRRFICGAETPARGMLSEYTHNLLTLSRGTLYYNTNLGAVAALRAEDGRVLWVSLYPRELRGDWGQLAPHWRRDLNPCVVHDGTLLVAPADSPRIFAFDALTGQLLWRTGTELEDAVHLLGTTGDWLLAGGGRLYWISLKKEDHGRVKHLWPNGPDRPGYGRGLLAGQNVLWPTRDKLYIFDQQTARLRKVIDLTARGARGGNLLVSGGQLLIATEKELIAISPQPNKPRPAVAPL